MDYVDNLNKIPHCCYWFWIQTEKDQGGSNLFLSSQTNKLMAATKFSDYLDLKHCKKAKKK